MSADEFARRCAEQVWPAGCRYAVVTSTLRRPGRGRSASGTNRGGWRAEDRPPVLARLDALAAEVVRGLASGSLSGGEARARVAEAGFAGCVRVAGSVGELAEQLAEVVRSGDNAWTDCSPDGGAVVYLRWWSDPSHPRVG
jgi:hypothetical protein